MPHKSVSRLKISTPSLEVLTDPQRQFFFLAGHMFNEIIILQRLLITATNSQDTGILLNARQVWGLVILRLLAGKVYEAWEAVRKHFVSVHEVATAQWCSSAHEVQDPLKILKKYFSHSNLVHDVRKNYGFHYTLPVADLSEYGSSDGIEFLMSDTRNSTLYLQSEAVVSSDMFDAAEPTSPVLGFSTMIIEVADAAGHMLDFLNAYIGCTCAYLAQQSPGCGEVVETLNIAGSPTWGSALIPMFIDG